MPGGDQTGPMGAGPMTGRRMGVCAGVSSAGYMGPVAGRGMGYGCGFGKGAGFGRGFGWRLSGGYGLAMNQVEVSDKEQAVVLKDQVQFLQKEIDALNARIQELDSK